jgi:outer membrane lipoprotein-sorting protein
MMALALLLALSSQAPAQLERLAAALRGAAAWQADFVQSYTPAGFAAATVDRGTVIVAAPARLRFDYSTGSRRAFAVDAVVARLVDFTGGTCDAVRLDEGAWARLPLAAILDPSSAERAFAVAAVGRTLTLTPRQPTADLSELAVTVDDKDMPVLVAVTDASGNRNEFALSHWRAAAALPDAAFRPGLPGEAPCAPEEP